MTKKILATASKVEVKAQQSQNGVVGSETVFRGKVIYQPTGKALISEAEVKNNDEKKLQTIKKGGEA